MVLRSTCETLEMETSIGRVLQDTDYNVQQFTRQFWITGIVVGTCPQVEITTHQEPLVGSATILNRGIGLEVESFLLEWVTKHNFRLKNTVLDGWQPTGAPKTGYDFCNETDESQQKWKIIDYVCAPVAWKTRSTIARNVHRKACLTNCWW